MSHTTGPWEFVIDGDWPMIYSAARDEDGHRIPVADLFHGGYDFADLGFPLACNARLMAASPELLQALKALVAAVVETEGCEFPGEYIDELAQARSAVAKAEASA